MKYLERNSHRAIPEEHENFLRTIFGLKPSDLIPASVLNEYWRTKEIYDLINLRIGPRELADIAIRSNVDHKAPSDPSIGQLLTEKVIKPRQLIKVKFRDSWKLAQLIDANLRDKTIRVVMEGDSTVRTIKDDKEFVKLITQEKEEVTT
jgi:hypothetical protein